MSPSTSPLPTHIVIARDEYHAEFVGTTADGRQFFLTTPFISPGPENATGCEYIALYVFDQDGVLLEATIDDLGPRANLDNEARERRRDEMIRSLGAYEYCDIKIAPFRVERFGVEFGLIVHPPEDPDGDWCAIFEPGDVMCFWPPWTSGDYDT